MAYETATKEAVIGHFEAWAEKKDHDLTLSFIDENVEFDMGSFKISSKAQYAAGLGQQNGWKDVKLIDSVFSGNQGVIAYEGTDAVTGQHIRVAEIDTVQGGKIVKAVGAMTMIEKRNY